MGRFAAFPVVVIFFWTHSLSHFRPHVQRLARTALPSAASPHVVRLSYGRPGEELPPREEIVDLALADAQRLGPPGAGARKGRDRRGCAHCEVC